MFFLHQKTKNDSRNICTHHVQIMLLSLKFLGTIQSKNWSLSYISFFPFVHITIHHFSNNVGKLKRHTFYFLYMYLCPREGANVAKSWHEPKEGPVAESPTCMQRVHHCLHGELQAVKSGTVNTSRYIVIVWYIVK